jgi:signal transduction histidine kinase
LTPGVSLQEENKIVARRFLEAQAKGDMETLDELMAQDFADRSLLPGQRPGREDYKQSVAEMLAVYANTGFTIEAQIAEGDHVVSRYTGSSVHRGKFLGVDPTGRESGYSGIAIHRIAGGKIVEEWAEADNLEVVQSALELELRRRERIEQEKMAALGKLSAGLAHELNNPAAAARRAAEQLREATVEAQLLALDHDGRLSPEVRGGLVGVLREAAAGSEVVLDPLSHSDREQELTDWLEERGFGEAWDLAPTLGAAGLDVGRLEKLAAEIDEGETLAGALEWLGATLRLTDLANQVGQSAGRISDLVRAMKEYTHMDRAAYAETDVREGLETTLTILEHKLKDAAVEREYEEDLPRIWSSAGELNQVWTNLIDNAIDAVEGNGNIKVRTSRENDRIIVEVVDDGSGIPEEIHSRIFDPFFTTKEIGEGTGLGLDIVRRIVAGHGGEITFHSEPGETRFTVLLPVNTTQNGD